ncbi:MAG: radical SAM protein [Paludibacteraceae bacterium]|nr:radical SAM protein [Paludibacteraceae bacterium]
MNFLRCRLSYLLRGSYRHFPTFVALEPADWCMLRCPQCPVGQAVGEEKAGGAGSAAASKERKRERTTMPRELYTRLIDEIAPFSHTVIFHFQGEPLLSPMLADMVAYAHSKRLFTMFSTNAQILTAERARELAEAGLDEIIISLDGLTQESYERYRRGGSLDKALSGVKALADLPQRSRPEIVVQCLRLKSNEHEWQLFKQQYRSLGADRLELKTAQFYDYENGNEEMPSDNRFCRYKQGGDGRWHIKNPLRNRCYRLWSGVVVTAKGEVRPCCYDKSGIYSFGSVAGDGCSAQNSVTLSEVLHSRAADDFRRRVFKQRRTIDICCNCVE